MRKHAMFVVGLIAITVPLFLAEPVTQASTRVLLMLSAAIGLNLAAGFAGVPLLSQGAFMGIGAYSVAMLRTRAHLDPVTAILAGVCVATIAGAFVARAVAHLKPAFVGVASWIGSFLFIAALEGFTSVTRGPSGIVLPPMTLRLRALGLHATAGVNALYLAAVLVAFIACGLVAAAERRWGAAMGAMRADRAAALASGIDVASLRRLALIISASLGGLAGAVLVQAQRAADPRTYGPLLSVKLFIAVLLGGAGLSLGPIFGIAVLILIDAEAALLARALGVSAGATQALSVAIALGLVSLLRGQGIATVFQGSRFTKQRTTPRPLTFDGASLEVRGVSVRYGGTQALKGAWLQINDRECHALVGPNGSGKTTMMRVIAGAQPSEEGDVLLDGGTIAHLDLRQRIRVGVARTLQRLPAPASQTVLSYVEAGADAIRLPGAVRHLLVTPAARKDRQKVRGLAFAALDMVGLSELAGSRVSEISAGDRRLVEIARAVLVRPRILVLDEPSVGLGMERIPEMVDVINRLVGAGLTVLVVEHNLALVRQACARVTVLNAGEVIANGNFEEVYASAAMQRAYFGEPIAFTA